MHIRSTHPLALALAASGLLTACGGSDSPAGSQAPRMQLSISATEDFAGSYGSVGAYEKVTGVLRGELDPADPKNAVIRSEEHTSELQSQSNLVCRLLLEKKKYDPPLLGVHDDF